VINCASRSFPLASLPPLVETVANSEVKAQLASSRDKMAIPPDAIARAIASAIEQPAEIDVNEIIVRPTAQG
jgi:NADP-dependent 3-hydroxy acid dehydrogenase YdfG